MERESSDAERDVPMDDDVAMLPDLTQDEFAQQSQRRAEDNDERLLAERPPHW